MDPWKFHSFFNEIKVLSSSMLVEFKHIVCSANGMANSLLIKKKYVNHSSPSVVFFVISFYHVWYNAFIPLLVNVLISCVALVISPFNTIYWLLIKRK